MTGIEKLRAYAEAYSTIKCAENLPRITGKCCEENNGCNACLKSTIDAIADQIERETMPRPLFEDGAPVQFGDAVCCDDGYTFTVDAIEVMRDGWFSLSQFSCSVSMTIQPGARVKRPEQPDTWECIELDVDTGRGFAGMDTAYATAKVLRRCKALAGVE